MQVTQDHQHRNITDKSRTLKTKRTLLLNYDSSYLKYGFTYTGDERAPISMFVVCNETLTNYAMKPSLLPRHFEPKQKDLKIKAMEFFQKN